jgi:hypothetical protein
MRYLEMLLFLSPTVRFTPGPLKHGLAAGNRTTVKSTASNFTTKHTHF